MSGTTRTLVAAIVAVATMTSCGSSVPHAGAPQTVMAPISVTDTCDGTLRKDATAAESLLGETHVNLGPSAYQVSIPRLRQWLRADTSLDAAGAKTRTLCAVQPENSHASLSISFEWEPFSGVPRGSGSTTYSSEYADIGYAASSRDDDALIIFSCRFPNGGENDGRNLYLRAIATTEGLNALPRAQKREAQVRVLHAAAVSVAAAMKCDTNLPEKLGMLTPLPSAR